MHTFGRSSHTLNAVQMYCGVKCVGNFKIPSTPPTTNKTIRFPNDVVESVEKAIDDAISAYVSQTEIIRGLVEARKERKTADGRFVEVYIAFDCRPKISFKPYTDWVEKFH